MNANGRRRSPPMIPPEAAGLSSNWAPVNVPQVLPSGYPHNLPPLRDRPVFVPFGGVGGIGASGEPALPSVFDPHRYATLIQGFLAVGLASIQMLSEPVTRRNMLAIRATGTAGTENIFVSFGTPATVNSWLRLTPNQIVLFDDVVPQNDIYCISDLATGAVSFAFSTLPV